MRYTIALAGLAALASAQVTSIVDGQPQAPTSVPAAVSQITDHQPQAPTSVPNAVSQITDHQPQAPTSVPPAMSVSSAPVPMKTTTTYVTHLTTYCPFAGTSTFGSQTYTVTKPTTLTVLDCSCTLTNTVPMVAPTMAPMSYVNGTSPAAATTLVPAVSAPAVTGTGMSMSAGMSAPASPLTSTVFVSTCPGCPATVPVVVGPTAAPVAGSNGTAPVAPTGAMTSAPAKFTGAASKVSGAGAGLAAVFGLAAYLL